jgi:DNA-binding transcriptional MerR regulator
VAKGAEAFRTISEAADEIGVPQHVLRFWETKFSFIKPMKRAGGRRFYRPDDVAVLAAIRRLLHEQGYTIKGVQKLHREQGFKRFALAGAEEEGTQAPPPPAPTAPTDTAPAMTLGDPRELEAVLKIVEAAKSRLDAVLAGR